MKYTLTYIITPIKLYLRPITIRHFYFSSSWPRATWSAWLWKDLSQIVEGYAKLAKLRVWKPISWSVSKNVLFKASFIHFFIILLMKYHHKWLAKEFYRFLFLYLIFSPHRSLALTFNYLTILWATFESNKLHSWFTLFRLFK